MEAHRFSRRFIFILQWRFPPSSTGRMWTLSYEQIIYRYFECFTYSSTFGWLLINRQQDWERSNCLYRSSSRDVHSGLQSYLRLFGKWRREDIFKRMYRMFWFRCCKLQARKMWIMHSLHWGRGRIRYRFTSGRPNVGMSSYELSHLLQMKPLHGLRNPLSSLQWYVGIGWSIKSLRDQKKRANEQVYRKLENHRDGTMGSRLYRSRRTRLLQV